MPTKRRYAGLTFFILTIAVLIAACESPRTNDAYTPESPADTASTPGTEDWEVLFDGESLDGWRGFRQQDVPDGWTVSDDGAIHFTTSEGDINLGLITEEEFSDFDLQFEWRVAPGGNSGVFFHVTEAEDTIWKTGPEYQIVDNEDHADGENPVTSAGSNYGLHGPDTNFANPPGAYNEGRIFVRDGLVEHFLNGQKVVEYELGTDDWEALVAQSPFNDMPAYGRNGSGHIALQEGGPVWFRNIRIRRLNSAE